MSTQPSDATCQDARHAAAIEYAEAREAWEQLAPLLNEPAPDYDTINAALSRFRRAEAAWRALAAIEYAEAHAAFERDMGRNPAAIPDAEYIAVKDRWQNAQATWRALGGVGEEVEHAHT